MKRILAVLVIAASLSLFAFQSAEVHLGTTVNVVQRVYGEGWKYLGTLSTNANGEFSGDISVPEGLPFGAGALVTGVTTHPTYGSSEFGLDTQVIDPDGGPMPLWRRRPVPLQGGGSWWDHGWHYRIPVHITPDPAFDLTVVEVRFPWVLENLSISGHYENGSARLVDPLGNALYAESEWYWREGYVELRIPTSELPGEGTYYLYLDLEENGAKSQYLGDPNWGFERGDLSGWVVGKDNAPNAQAEASPIGPYTVSDPDGSPNTITDQGDPYAGEYSLLLGYRDYDEDFGANEVWAYRDFQVPATGGMLLVRYNMHSWDSANFDWLTIEIRDTSNNTLSTLLSQYNPNSGYNYGSYATSGWQILNADLSPYAGQTVRLFVLLHLYQDNAYKSWVYVDAVEIPSSVIEAVPGSSEAFEALGGVASNDVRPGEYISLWLRSEATATCGAIAEIYDPSNSLVATVQLYDDGTHGDPVAGDGNYTNTQAYQIQSGDPSGIWTIVFKSRDCSSSTISSDRDGLAHRQGRPTDPISQENYYNAYLATVRVWGSGIYGVVYEDRRPIGDHYDPSTDLPEAGVRYRIYADDGDGVLDDGDALVDEGTTGPGGTFYFDPPSNGLYFVAVNSRDVHPHDSLNSGYTFYDAWADQTFGVWWDGSSFVSGERFGGGDPDSSDFFNETDPTPSNNHYEHVSPVYVGAGGIPPMEFGFSFDIIDSSADYAEGEAYRIPITVSNPSGSDLYDFQVRLVLNPSNFDYSHAEPDGGDLRFYLEGGGELGYWIQRWDPGGTSVVWVRIPYIPADGVVNLYMYYGDARLGSLSDVGIMDFMEVGSVTTSNTFDTGDDGNDPSTWTWDHVDLNRRFSEPVVVAQFLSWNGRQSAVIRIKDPSPSGFDLRVIEPSNRDNLHLSEVVGYIVMDEGLFQTVNGLIIWSHKYDTTSTVGRNVDNVWDSFGLSPIPFPTDPIVFAQPMTSNDVSQQHRFVKCRLRGLRNSDLSFDVALEEEFDNDAQRPTAETVALIAIQRNTTQGSWYMLYPAADGGTVLVEWGVSYDDVWGIYNGWKKVIFPQAFSNTPILVLSYGSYDGADNSELRYRKLGSSSFQVAVEEDSTHGSDSERNTRHTSEDAFWMAFSRPALLPIAKYAYPYPSVSMGTEEDVLHAGQGTVRRFIQNSNAIAGPQESETHMRSPAAPEGWWVVHPFAEMDHVTDHGTVLNLTNDVDAVPGSYTVTDALGSSIQIPLPEVEMNGDGQSWNGLTVEGDDFHLMAASITNFGVDGIRILGSNAVVNASLIGVRPDLAPLPVGGNGISLIGGGAVNATVSTASGNGFYLSSDGSELTWSVSNGSGTGILVSGNSCSVTSSVSQNSSSQGILIEGDWNTVVRSVVRYNGEEGIVVLGDGDSLRILSVYNNTGLGIDLGGDGVTDNDGSLDPSLPNHGVDFPIITLAKWYPDSRTLHVEGYVGSGSGSPDFANCFVDIYLVRYDGYGDDLEGNY